MEELRAPLESGLFSAVVYEAPGTRAPAVATDWVLEVGIDRKLDIRWYSYLGGVTLGVVPVSVPEVATLRAVLRDASGREVASFHEEDHVQYVLWLPLLPLDALFSTVAPCGELLGLDLRVWDRERRDTLDVLLATVLAKANNQVRFTRGPA